MSHNHELVSEHDLRRPTESLFTPHGHSAADLSWWACGYIKNAIKSPASLQRQARDFLKSERISWEYDSYHMETAAGQCLRIFDDLFFFGSLVNRCTITWASLGPHILGQTFLSPGAPRCDIELDIKFTGDSAFDTILLLSTLIHEMCHTFLPIYACDVSGCREKREHSGETGHSSVWEAMAVAVEWTALRAFNMKLDLGISSCTQQRQIFK
jgi:hypothetical protein